MTPETLTVRNFQGIREASLTLSPLTLFFGVTGSGKTSLMKALDYLLTGSAGYGPAVNLPDLIRQGEKSLDVSGTVDGVKIERHRTASAATVKRDGKTVPAGSVEAGWPMPVAAIAAALRAGQLFSLKPAELLTLLRGLLPDLDPSASKIQAAIGADVIDAAARVKIELPKSLDEFKTTNGKAVDYRIKAKRRKKKLQGDLDRIEEPEGEAGSKALAQIQLAHGNEQAARERLEDILQGLRDQVAAAEAATNVAAAFDRGGLESTAKHHRDRIKELEPAAKKGTGPVSELREVDTMLATAETDLRSEERAADTHASDVAVHEAHSEAEWVAPDELAEITKDIARLTLAVSGHNYDQDAADAGQVEHYDTEIETVTQTLTGLNAEKAELLKEHAAHRTALGDVPGAAAVDCPQYPDTKCPLEPVHFKTLRTAIEEKIVATLDSGKAAADKIAAAETNRASLITKHAQAVKAMERLDAREQITEKTAAHAEAEKFDRDAHAVAVETAEVLLAASRKDLDASRTRIETLTQSIAADRIKAEDLREQVANAKAADEAASALATARDALAATETRLSAPAPETPDDMTETLARIEAGGSIVDAIRVYESRSSKAAEIEHVDEEIDDAHAVAKATGSGGVRARMISEAASPLLVAANGSLEQFAPGFSVALECDGDLQFRVQTPTANVLAEQLSSGERRRVLYVLQYAVARLAGVDVIAIDEAELVSPASRREMMGTFRAWAADGMTVLALNNADAPESVPAGVAAYAVADGLVERVSER